MMSKLDERKILQVNHASGPGQKILMTRILVHDLFAIANLVVAVVNLRLL